MSLSTSHLQLQYDGLTRMATLVTPTNAILAAPLVLCFHGGRSHPEGVRWESRFDEVAERNGFSLLYPAGTNRFGGQRFFWNDGRPYADGTHSQVDDVGFVRALLNSGQFSYDREQVYAAGYSNGAMFCYRLAQQLSDRIAAVACVAGQRGPNEFFPQPPRPISVMQFSGRQDRIAPYGGGSPRGEPEFVTNLLPVRTALRQWADFNRVGTPEVRAVGRSAVETKALGDGGVEVILWSLADGGHTWPGGNRERWFLGGVNQDVFAADEMWRFFARHKLIVD